MSFERSRGVAHVPVLVREVMELLAPRPGDTLLDATIGHGGHAKAYLEAADGTRVIGIDADAVALEHAGKQLAAYKDRVRLTHGIFANLGELIGSATVTHALFDLGIGSHQLADDTRGFSFRSKAPLAMLYGTGQGLPVSNHQAIAWIEKRIGHTPDAGEVIAYAREEELADIIWKYGEERFSRRIARAIKHTDKIQTAEQLAGIIAAAVPGSYEHGRIHPATRTFQALRIVVNRELESLEMALPQATGILEDSGKLVVISFHSLEDRLVKQFMRSEDTLEVLTKKPVRASKEEQHINPRARSAKLRVAQKLNNQKQTHDSKHFTTRRIP